jgi:hypothetical protein
MSTMRMEMPYSPPNFRIPSPVESNGLQNKSNRATSKSFFFKQFATQVLGTIAGEF